MEINYKFWMGTLIIVGLIGFSGCKDDDDISLDDARNMIEANGNDLIDWGLYGSVKMLTETNYQHANWVNGTIQKNRINDQDIVEFNQGGFITKENSLSNTPTACKWAKDKNGTDVIVVTTWSMKPTESSMYSYDTQNRYSEVIDNWTYYNITFGGYPVWSSDTIYVGGTPDITNTTFTTNIYESGSKALYSYDDANKKATVTYYDLQSDDTYTEDYQRIYDLNKYGKINYNSYEEFPVKSTVSIKDFDTNFDEKAATIYDAQGNPTSFYWIYSDGNGGYIVNQYIEISYTYY